MESKNHNLRNIKNKLMLMKIFNNLSRKKKLEIIKQNKKVQNRLNIGIKDFKEYLEIYSPIVIEVFPSENKFGNFLNFTQKERKYFHIFYNNNKEEQNKLARAKDKVKAVKIMIDYQVKSFYSLFKNCKNIEHINFKKFSRKTINNMSYMFNGCTSLKEINFSNFNTDSVTTMRSMFSGCTSLKKINLSNFSTSKVTNMSYMFSNCSSLNEIINVSKLNTNKEIDRSYIFFECSKELIEKLKNDIEFIES